MPFSRLRKGAFCIFLNPRLNGKPGVVHLYWQLMACGDGSLDVKERLLFASPFCNYIFILQQTDPGLTFEEKVKLYHIQMLG